MNTEVKSIENYPSSTFYVSSTTPKGVEIVSYPQTTRLNFYATKVAAPPLVEAPIYNSTGCNGFVVSISYFELVNFKFGWDYKTEEHLLSEQMLYEVIGQSPSFCKLSLGIITSKRSVKASV